MGGPKGATVVKAESSEEVIASGPSGATRTEDVKKKEATTTPSASTSSPTSSTGVGGRSLASLTSGAKSASASTQKPANLPNIIYNQNLYTGTPVTQRPSSVNAPKADYPTVGKPMSYQELTQQPGFQGYGGLSYDQFYSKTPEEQNEILRQGEVGDITVKKYQYETAMKENEANKIAFAEQTGVPVDMTRPDAATQARDFAAYVATPEYSYLNQKVVDTEAVAAQNPEDPTNQVLLQKAKAERDTYANNLALSATYKQSFRESNAFSELYSPQIAEVDKIDQELEAWPKDSEGNPVAASQEEVDRYNSLVRSRTAITSDEGFATFRDQLLQRSSDIDALYENQKQIIRDNPVWFIAQEQAKSAAAQTEAYLAALGPVFEWKAKNIDNPATTAVVDFAIGFAYLPKAFGDGDSYGWTDSLYDKAALSRQIAVSPYLPVEDSVIAKTVSAATTMALMVGTAYAIGGLGVAAGLPAQAAMRGGQVVAGFVATSEGYYRAGIEAGMSESEAENFSIISGLVQGSLEMVNPEAAFVGPDLFKNSTSAYMKVIAEGGAKSLARKEAMKVIGKNILGENIQEFSQQIGEWGVNMKANQITGANLDVGEKWGEQLAETAIITTLLSGIVGGVQTTASGISANRMNSEATYVVGKETLKYKERVATMLAAGEITQEKAAEINAKIDRAQQIVSRIPEQVPPTEAVDLIPVLDKKLKLEEQKKQSDKAFVPAIEAEIAQVEKEIQQQSGMTPPVETDEQQMELDKEEVEALRAMKRAADAMKISLSEEETARLNELEEKLKPKEDAIEKGSVTESDQQEYKDGDEARKIAEAISGDSTQQSGQVQEEVTVTPEPAAEPAVEVQEEITATEDVPEEVQRINEDVAKIDDLTYSQAARKAGAVKKRIANAVKSGLLTKESGQNLSKEIDAKVKEKTSAVSEKATKAIDEAADTIKRAGEATGIIGKSFYINPETGEKVYIQKNSLLDPAKLVDIGAAMIKRAVSAGIDINVAVNTWMGAMQEHPAYKNLVATQGQDVADKFANEMKAKFMATGEEFVEPKETKSSRMAGLMRDTKDLPKEFVDAMESEGLDYIPQGEQLQSDEADAMIAFHEDHSDLDGLLDKIQDGYNGMQPDVRSMLATRLYNRYSELQQEALDKGDTEAYAKYAERAGRAWARGNNMISMNARALRNASRVMHSIMRKFGIEGTMAQLSGMVQEGVDETAKDKKNKKRVKDITDEVNEALGKKGKGRKVSADSKINSLVGKFGRMMSEKIPDGKEKVDRIVKLKEIASELDKHFKTDAYSQMADQYAEIKSDEKAKKEADSKINSLARMMSSKMEDTKEKMSKEDRMKQIASEIDAEKGGSTYSDMVDALIADEQSVKNKEKVASLVAEAEAAIAEANRRMASGETKKRDLWDVLHEEATWKMQKVNEDAIKVAKLIQSMREKFKSLDEDGRRKMLVSMLTELNDKGLLSDARVQSMFKEALFAQEFTPELQQTIREHLKVVQNFTDLEAKRKQDVNNLKKEYDEKKANAPVEKVGEIDEWYRNELRKINDAIVEAQYRADEAHAEISAKFLGDRSLLRTLGTMMVFNFFTTGGIIQNLLYNVETLSRLSRGVVATGLSYIFTGVHNARRKAKGRDPLALSNNIAAQVIGLNRYGLRYGMKDVWERAVKGVTAVEDFDKFDIRRELRPYDALISLAKKRRPNQTFFRFFEDKLAAAAEGTVGWMSVLAARGMATGDAIFRNPAYYAKLTEIAMTTKGLKSRADIDEFVLHPDEDSKRYAEAYAADIVFQKATEGLPADMTERIENLKSKVEKGDVAAAEEMNELFVDLVEKGPQRILQRAFGTGSLAQREAGRVASDLYFMAIKSQFPFIRTLTRAVPHIMAMTMPWVGFSKGMINIWKAAEMLNKYDDLPKDSKYDEARGKYKFAADMHRSEAMSGFAQGMIATSIAMTAAYYFVNGVITGGDDDDKLSKEAGVGPYKINISALSRQAAGDDDWNKARDGDEWLTYDNMGLLGIALASNVDNIRKEGGIPAIEQSFDVLDYMEGAGLAVFPKVLDIPMVRSTATVLDALRRGGTSQDKWLSNTYNSLVTSIYPNTLSTFSKLSDPYERQQTTNGTAGERFFDRMKVNTFQGSKLPPKVSVFGEDMKSETTGQDLLWRGNVKSIDTESLEYKLVELKRQIPVTDGAFKKIEPPDVDVSQTPPAWKGYQYKTVNLDPQQYHDLSQAVGRARKAQAEFVMSSDEYKMGTPQRKAELLSKAWDYGLDEGKSAFFMTHPELLIVKE